MANVCQIFYKTSQYNSSYDNLWMGANNADGIYYYDLTLPDGTYYKGWLNIVR